MPFGAAHAARAAPAAVVLQAAADDVRLPHVGADLVELPDRAERVDELPGLGLVVGDVEAAVVADHHVVVIARIDPDGVMIAVREPLHLPPGLAAVDGLEERRAALIRDVGVGRIDADLAVVHRPIHRVRQELPRLAGIVRPPDAGLVGIGRGQGPRRVRRRHLRRHHRRRVRAFGSTSVPSSLTPAPVPPLGPTSIDA